MQPLPWDMIGAIAGVLSFLLTLLVEWKNLGTWRRIMIALVIGIVAFLVVNSVAPLLFPPPSGTPTENPPVANPPATAETVSPIGQLVIDENFDDGTDKGFSSLSGNWKVVDDGTGKNMVLETKNGNDNKWAHIEFGPSDFSNGTIEYSIRLINYNASSQDGGKTSLQWRAKQWGDKSYALDIQPYFGHFTLDYQGAYPSNEWVNLGEVNLFPKLGIWYLIKLEIQGDKMTVYLNNELKISANDSRLTSAGRLAFNVDSEAQVQFDNVKVWELGK